MDSLWEGNSSVKEMKCTVKEQNKGLCDWSIGTRRRGMVPDRLENSCAGDDKLSQILSGMESFCMVPRDGQPLNPGNQNGPQQNSLSQAICIV